MNPRIVVLSRARAGEVFPVSGNEFVIGRDETADLAIAHHRLSRRHCVLTLEGGQYQLQDCGSANGTTLNGEGIKAKSALNHGDRIGMGATEVLFLTGTDAAGSAEPPVYFDDTPIPGAETIVPARGNILLGTLLGFTNALRNTRDALAIREKLLSFIFNITPADRAAVLLIDRAGIEFETLAGRNRREPARQIRVSRTIAERVYKDGAAVVSNNLAASGIDHIESLQVAEVKSIVCVPMEAFDRRVGVIYADASDPEAQFDKAHLELLTAVATTAAIAFEHAAHLQLLESENSRLQHDLEIRTDLVGESPAMAEQARLIAKIAPTDSTVLIRGESGTGKELVARAIHRNSKRSGGPFVAINCAAVPENLLESELFGHEKGAFSGADSLKKGIVEAASGGTLFLDEVGELTPAMQAKLLRVLQEREIQRVGGTRSIKVDIRIIAATNRDLESAVERKEFRQDLYFRLNVVSVRTPTLRERREDIPLLARHFISLICRQTGRVVRGLSLTAERMLKDYHWPGNVRELQNAMERAIVLGSSDVVLPEDLPAELFESQSGGKEPPLPHFYAAVNATKSDLLEKAFARSNGNPKEAAALLGLNLTFLYRLLKNMNLDHLRKPR